jgi:hypothetical protein
MDVRYSSLHIFCLGSAALDNRTPAGIKHEYSGQIVLDIQRENRILPVSESVTPDHSKPASSLRDCFCRKWRTTALGCVAAGG